MSEPVALPAKCYVITATELDHHTDRKGRMKLPTKQAFSTLKEANAAAFSHLINRYDSTSDPIGQPEYQNKESETELSQGSFIPAVRNVHEYVVRVREFKMNYPKLAKERGGKKAAAATATAAGTGQEGQAGHQGTGAAGTGNTAAGAPIPPLMAARPNPTAQRHAGPSRLSDVPLHKPPTQAAQTAGPPLRPLSPLSAATPLQRGAHPGQRRLGQTSTQSAQTTAFKRSHTTTVDVDDDDDVVILEDEDGPSRKKKSMLDSEVRPALEELSADDIASMFTR
ncbi:hypothetical protein QFC22_002537 [Naganishia vaughanmartiniae]|uniref:Uncharacterized protein n=1 Tax=Naganishia vaughanmartiniae TaxID=1424756 RepID=A0ACC2X9A2_9TREE|nr:hypothetical protein QFC22_002537 [Naganishia vaughanmartiniae]